MSNLENNEILSIMQKEFITRQEFNHMRYDLLHRILGIDLALKNIMSALIVEYNSDVEEKIKRIISELERSKKMFLDSKTVPEEFQKAYFDTPDSIVNILSIYANMMETGRERRETGDE